MPSNFFHRDRLDTHPEIRLLTVRMAMYFANASGIKDIRGISYFCTRKLKYLKVIRQSLLHIALFLQCTMMLGTASAQSERPKIGLVLSGGGAKGMAHIGVLKVMERAGIVPDYITGTSMGSIVGGLYALGYTADELEQIVYEMDWDKLLTNRIDLDGVAIEEKQYYGRYIAELPVNGLAVGLPKGLIEGQKLSETLTVLTRSSHNINDFSKLSIPFACVATDLASGEPVLLDKGSLPECIRASMAIPTVFTPVEIDDRLLVDGGLVRNFPVEEVLAMGADIVIGIFVSSDLEPKEKLNNIFSVLMQSAWVTSAFDTRRQRQLVDLYIEPDLEGYSTGSFKSSPEIIRRGEEAGLAHFEQFKKLADSVYRAANPERPPRLPLQHAYRINRITIVGSQQIPDRLITGKLGIEPNDTLSIDEIERRITLLHGTGYFTKITYQLRKTGEGTDLIVKTIEAPDGLLKVGAHYDSENEIGINANLTYRNLIFPQSRTIAELDLAPQPRFDLNYLKYTGVRQNLAISLGTRIAYYDLPSYDRGEKDANFKNQDYKLYLQLQTTARQGRTYGMRLQHNWTRLSPNIGDSTVRSIEAVRSAGWAISPFLQVNTLNKPFFPTKGSVFSLRYSYKFGVDAEVTLAVSDSLAEASIAESQEIPGLHAVELNYDQYIPLSPRFTGIVGLSTSVTNLEESGLNLSDYYFIGGFNPIYGNSQRFFGAKYNEYLMPNYLTAALGIQWEFGDYFYLTGIVNYVDSEYPMQILYPDAASADLDGLKRRTGMAVRIGFDSIFGPIILSAAKDFNRQGWLFHFNLGFWYR
jgi:NTE family protein